VADRRFLTRYAWLSIAVALAAIALKSAAYVFTGSVGLLSDALESLVNLAGALMALTMLLLAARQPNESYNYGFAKAEYFSSVVEGTLIVVAAASIAWTAIPRLAHPAPLAQIGVGLAISMLASLLNLATALVLRRAGRRYRSVTLEGNAKHLFADVWTSIGVLVAVGAVAVTGWLRLDPVIALVVAVNIVWTGVGLVRRSVGGLLDRAWPADEQKVLTDVLARYRESGIAFHAIRTRVAGAERFVSMHVLVPGDWSVQRGHELLERIEHDIANGIAGVTVVTHLEPLEDPASWDDTGLARGSKATRPASSA
jgi:cation diffusion facilitator family transporter